MKYLLLVLLLLTGCTPVTVTPGSDEPQVLDTLTDVFQLDYFEQTLNKPIVDLPYAMRYWNSTDDGGSCVHRSMGNLFNHMNAPEWAAYWTAKYTGGDYPDETFNPNRNLAKKLRAEGVPFAYTLQEKDVAFLEWSIDTQRGCNVTVMGGAHMVTLVHLDDESAGILDNNDPRKILWVTRQSFLNEWFASNSWAVTPLLTPSPPR